jgi:hypothetical protein
MTETVKTNYETLRVKLEFVFRMLVEYQYQLLKNVEHKYFVERQISEVANVSLALVYKYRKDGGFTVSEEEIVNATAFIPLVTDFFQTLDRKIFDG